MDRPGGSAVLAAVKSCLGPGRSWMLRLYAPVGSLVALFAVLLVALALPTWVAQVERASATLLLGPGLLVLGGLGVAGGALAPLFAAARRLPEPGAHPGHERIYGTFGFGFVVAVYLGFVISAPPAHRSDPGGPVAPLVDWLYGLDAPFGLVPPAAILLALVVYDRTLAP